MAVSCWRITDSCVGYNGVCAKDVGKWGVMGRACVLHIRDTEDSARRLAADMRQDEREDLRTKALLKGTR